jgi:hypothetical protein
LTGAVPSRSERREDAHQRLEGVFLENAGVTAGPYHQLGIKDYLRCLGIRSLGLILLRRLFYIHHVLIMKLNLKTFQPRSFERPPGGDLRLLTPEDMPRLLSAAASLKAEDRRELLARIHFYDLGFSKLYGVFTGSEIAYIQWLVTPEDNPVIRARYHRLFFELKPGQVLLENVFTFPRYRGLGYLPFATERLLVKAREMGFQTVIVYIRNDKITTLNEFVQMGFRFANLLRIFQVFGFIRRKLLLPRL